MNEYGETNPADQPRPEGEPETVEGAQRDPAPTWQWTGTEPADSQPTTVQPMGITSASAQPAGVQSSGGYPPQFAAPMSTSSLPSAYPFAAGAPAPAPRSGLSRRARGMGVAAALLLVGGAAAGGAAFGFAHGHDGSSATGIASGDSGITAPTVPGQSPAPASPSTGGESETPRQRRGGRSSSYTPPGKATTDQQIGVVAINTKLKYQGAKAAGTGMILSPDGEILTNNHVIEGSTKIKVTVVATGKVYPATVVGTDKVDDIAVLQLTGASGLSTITPDNDGVQVGDAVTAVGNAMGLGGIPSAAKGSVIGLNRSITTQSEGGVEGERLTGMIQVDAQVISGDSGGPLYDAENEVIGMDTAASSSPLESLGFAIPIAKAMSIAEQIDSGQDGGNITLGLPGFLGVEFQPGASGSGADVVNVLPKTPAADAGMLPGDRITALSGTAITSGEQLRELLLQHRGGDSVTVTWRDSQGGSHTESVTLIDGPAE